MKYFFDTEFIEDGETIDLISIGIVSEDGRELYLQNQECKFKRASDWVAENVLTKLSSFSMREFRPSEWTDVWKSKNDIAQAIMKFTGQDNVEFWAYYADYDWVVLCQLFGTMMDLPRGYPMYCRDIKQEADRLLIDIGEKIPDAGEHNALADALRCKRMYEFLQVNTPTT